MFLQSQNDPAINYHLLKLFEKTSAASFAPENRKIDKYIPDMFCVVFSFKVRKQTCFREQVKNVPCVKWFVIFSVGFL